MLYEECEACGGVSCSRCRGRGFVATGVTSAQLDRLARGSPDRARLMLGALKRIAAMEVFFDEGIAAVKEARETLAALADRGGDDD